MSFSITTSVNICLIFQPQIFFYFLIFISYIYIVFVIFLLFRFFFFITQKQINFIQVFRIFGKITYLLCEKLKIRLCAPVYCALFIMRAGGHSTIPRLGQSRDDSTRERRRAIAQGHRHHCPSIRLSRTLAKETNESNKMREHITYECDCFADCRVYNTRKDKITRNSASH